MAGRSELVEHLQRLGAVSVRDFPTLARACHAAARDGLVTALLPGVYVATERAADVDVRISAAAAWIPDGVVAGAAAARVTFWPTIVVPTVTIICTRLRHPPSGFTVTKGSMPPTLVRRVGEIRVTTPALTALDLGPAGIDQALLRRACSLADMHDALALTKNREGNPLRRQSLHDSRDEPWSEAERLAHAVLRAAGLRGWRTNHPIRIAAMLYYLDIAFPAARVAVEIDGFAFHSDRETFESDRRKASDLTAAGWLVLRFTWRQLEQDPDWVVRTIKRALRHRTKSAQIREIWHETA